MTALPVVDLEAVAIEARDRALGRHCVGSPLLCGQCLHFDNAGGIGAPGNCLAVPSDTELRDANAICPRPSDFAVDTREFTDRYPGYPENWHQLCGASMAFHQWRAEESVKNGERDGVAMGDVLWTFSKDKPLAKDQG